VLKPVNVNILKIHHFQEVWFFVRIKKKRQTRQMRRGKSSGMLLAWSRDIIGRARAAGAGSFLGHRSRTLSGSAADGVAGCAENPFEVFCVTVWALEMMRLTFLNQQQFKNFIAI